MGVVFNMDINGDWLTSATPEEIAHTLYEVCRAIGNVEKHHARNNGFADARGFDWNRKRLVDEEKTTIGNCEECGGLADVDLEGWYKGWCQGCKIEDKVMCGRIDRKGGKQK